MMFVDGHAHLYGSYVKDDFFSIAYDNFRCAAATHGASVPEVAGVILFADTNRDGGFGGLIHKWKGEKSNKPLVKWHLENSNEPESWFAVHSDGRRICLILGRQIETNDGLEILALGTDQHFNDGGAFFFVLEDVIASKAIPVIPWGVGKWIGRRGRIIETAMDHYSNRPVFLGDNGGRPWFWTNPRLFRLASRKGIRILPGSDPLPFKNGHGKVGGFGFRLDEELNQSTPAEQLREILFDGKTVIKPYGSLERCASFIFSQFKMQVRKYFIRFW